MLEKYGSTERSGEADKSDDWKHILIARADANSRR
jgi:hypothetical protein